MINHIKYQIEYIENCNMCGASMDNFQIMGKRLNRSQGKSPSKKIGITTTVCKCKSCNLIFANPSMVPEEINDHYGISPEEYWTEEYFDVDENYFQGELKWMKKLMRCKKGMKSLDIGSGIGKQMNALGRAGFEPYGLEPSKSFYDRSINKFGISPDRLKFSTIEKAEYKIDQFDFISFGAVLEHLYDPSLAISKAIRWLKPNGLVHIEVPSSDWLINRIANTYYRIRGLDYVANISPMHPPFHQYEFSPKSFLLNSRINGYTIKDHGYYVCKTYMPKLLDPVLSKIMSWNNSGMQLCIWLEKKNDH
ncbi:MAG: class I SAM-dependent methyltransferase [Cyclobacteriaceae bacterium]